MTFPGPKLTCNSFGLYSNTRSSVGYMQGTNDVGNWAELIQRYMWHSRCSCSLLPLWKEHRWHKILCRMYAMDLPSMVQVFGRRIKNGFASSFFYFYFVSCQSSVLLLHFFKSENILKTFEMGAELCTWRDKLIWDGWKRRSVLRLVSDIKWNSE